MHHGRRPLLAAWFLLALAACRPGGASQPAAARKARPLPPPAEGVLSAEEDRIVGVEGRFLSGLPEAIGRPDLVREPPEETLARLKSYTDRFILEAAALAPVARALPPERWLVVQDELSRRNHREVEAFYERLAQASHVYTEDRREEARAILAGVLAPWREAGALWVFEMFSPEAAEEIAEFALGRDAGEDGERQPGKREKKKREGTS